MLPTVQISVLTQKHSAYGLKLLNLLQGSGIQVQQVVVFVGTWARRARWLRRFANHIGWIGSVRYLASGWGRSPYVLHNDVWRGRALERDYARLARRVDFAQDPWSLETVEALRAGQPDLCLLAHTEIVPNAVLDVPKFTTLNAHPGILPDYRGSDPELWAIYEGRFDCVGCTLHIAQRRVDAGPILATRRYTWRGDETLDLLSERLMEMNLDLLAGACHEAWPDYLAGATPQSIGRLYYIVPPGLRGKLENRLRSFLSQRQ